MSNHKIQIIVSFLTILIALSSCEKGVNVNNTQEIITPGRRDYVWTIDTLNLDPFEYLADIWGGSPNDVWAIGTSGIWHYNGKTWNSVGHYSGLNLYRIFGLSSSDIWVLCSPGDAFYHYDGSSWNTIGNLSYPGYWLTCINGIYGDSPNNLFAVGWVENKNYSTKPVILKYDGANWKWMDIQSVDAGLLSITRDTKGTGKYFIYGEKVIWDTTITPVTCKGFIEKIFEYDGNVNLTEIFSSPNESRFVNQISGRVYFTSSGKSNIWKYMNGKFEVWKDFSSTGYQIGTIWGRSEADIFCWSSFNKNYNISILSHYNGTDLQPLYQADNFNNARIIGDDVFVIIEGKTRGIAHGRLKNN